MYKLKIFFLALPLVLLTSFCMDENKEEENTKIVIDESYQTKRNEIDNVDSPAFWKNSNGEGWLISTAKSTDRLLVNNATNGSLIKVVGKTGDGRIEFRRPNGIYIIDSLLFVVERDNRRVQVLSLPDFKFITLFGETDLIKPYGIYINKTDSSYKIYVTDNYESEDETIPADSLLNERILVYNYDLMNSLNNIKLVKKFGETTNQGKLKIVESIYGDPEYNNLLIAEEKENETCVKVYDLDGNYRNQIIGKGLFKYQVEGIALYKSGSNDGFWIITDQDSANNSFHIFSRKNFKHLGYFQNPNTTNTDGIWLTQENYKGFPDGAFFAVHNDGNVSCSDLKLIVDKFM